jgi:hypothetical protein
MNDLPSTALLQQANARSISGEDLEVFGKEAASRYTGGRSQTLNEAVVETVKHAGLSPEHVKRVVEFANTNAFLHEFRKEGDHKVVEFQGGPANYSDILKDLNDGGGGTVFDAGSSDYEGPPPALAKTAAANEDRLGVGDVKLASAFGIDEKPIPYAEPLQDSLELKEKLASLYEGVSSSLSSLETHYIDVCDHLYGEVKEAALSGTTLSQIVAAWSTVNDDPVFIKAAFQQMTPRLLQGEVFASKEAIGESLIKMANVGIVNPKHPLVETYGEFCETLSKLAGARQVQQETLQSLDQISTFLKAAVRGGLAGKAWRGAKEYAEAAAPKVEQAVAGLAGQTAGRAAGAVTKKVPHVAAGAAGVKGYQESKTGRGPIGGPVRFARSFNPFRRQYYSVQ